MSKPASIPADMWTDLNAILRALPHSAAFRDNWLKDGRFYVVGVTQAELEAAATAPAAPPVPASVALWRARAALAEAGLIGAVNAGVASLGPAAVQWWEYGAEVERAHPRIAEIAAALGLTDPQVDDLFRRAATIEP